jgi:hypothetical protein
VSASAAVLTASAASPVAAPTGALTAQLEQLRDLLSMMPVSVYRACPAPRVSGSIGEQVRHCLDHVHALASATVVTTCRMTIGNVAPASKWIPMPPLTRLNVW